MEIDYGYLLHEKFPPFPLIFFPDVQILEELNRDGGDTFFLEE